MSANPSAAALPDTPEPEYQEWVHATNAGRLQSGTIFGWPDKRSATGFLSGVVVRSDHLHLRVLVRDIRAGVVK